MVEGRQIGNIEGYRTQEMAIRVSDKSDRNRIKVQVFRPTEPQSWQLSVYQRRAIHYRTTPLDTESPEASPLMGRLSSR